MRELHRVTMHKLNQPIRYEIITPNKNKIIQIEHNLDINDIINFDSILYSDTGIIKPYHFDEKYRFDCGINEQYIWIKPIGIKTENKKCKLTINLKNGDYKKRCQPFIQVL